MDHDQNRKSTIFLLTIFLLVVLITCAGCSTPPVKQKWPEAPSIAMQACPDLDKLGNDAKLSDIAKTININYSRYYECAVKVDAWIEWYNIQKTIYESTHK